MPAGMFRGTTWLAAYLEQSIAKDCFSHPQHRSQVISFVLRVLNAPLLSSPSATTTATINPSRMALLANSGPALAFWEFQHAIPALQQLSNDAVARAAQLASSKTQVWGCCSTWGHNQPCPATSACSQTSMLCCIANYAAARVM